MEGLREESRCCIGNLLIVVLFKRLCLGRSGCSGDVEMDLSICDVIFDEFICLYMRLTRELMRVDKDK